MTAPPPDAWCTAGCARPRTPRLVATGAPTAMPGTPPELTAVMNRIDGAGRERFADSYAGLEVDQLRVCAIVYRVPAEALDEFIRDAAGDCCVEVRAAAHTLAELTAWQRRVAADLPWWAGRGIAIATVGARHDGTGVDVGVQDVERARRDLSEHYGAAAPLLFVSQGQVFTVT